MENENSYMIVIPEKTSDLKNAEVLVDRLSNTEGIEVVGAELDDKLYLMLRVEKQTYDVEVWPVQVEIPEMYRIQHTFSDLDLEVMQNSAIGLEVSMVFDDHALTSYHAQLKIIHALLPDAVAVLDNSSEKVLSGMWVRLAAESKVPPAPRYIYTVQAVYEEEEDCVWLHTHGLNRCGLTELEILNSTKETCDIHYNVIETMAGRMLELEEELEYYEPFYIAMVTENIPLLTTIVDWREAVEQYDDNMLGGAASREDSHNMNTSAIFCYLSPEDIDNKEYSEIQSYDDLLGENPLYMLSNAETERMKRLARERIHYMTKMVGKEDVTILVKIGLELDEEYNDVDISKEHIWFELIEARNGSVVAELTQEPYYVKDLHEGSIGEYSFDDITDWIIFTNDGRITPDDVYLLESDNL